MALDIAVIKDGVEVFLKLPTNLTMTITDYSSVWDWELAMKGGYSMSVMIPVPGNEMVFDFAHLPATVGKTYEWPARVYDNGVLEYVGVLSIRTSEIAADKSVIDADFLASAMSYHLAEKNLRDELSGVTINIGDSISEIKDYMDSTFLAEWPSFPVTFFPIYAPKFYGENWAHWNGFCNTWKDNEFKLDEVLTGTTPPINETWRYNCVPQPFVLEILKSIFSNHGYRMIGSALTNVDLKILTSINLKALDHVAGYSGKVITRAKQVYSTTPAFLNWDEKLVDHWPVDHPMTVPGTAPFDPDWVLGVYQGTSVPTSKLILNIGEIGGQLKVYKHAGGTDTLLGTFDVWPNTQFVLPYTDNAYSLKVCSSDGILEVLEGSTYAAGMLFGNANWINGQFALSDIVPDIKVADYIQAVHQMGVEFVVDDLKKEVEIRMIADSLQSNEVIHPDLLIDRTKSELRVNQTCYVSFSNEDTDLKGLEYAGNHTKIQDVTLTGFYAELMYKYILNENNYYKRIAGDELELLGPASFKILVGNGSEEQQWTIKARLPLVKSANNGEQDIISIYWDDEGNSNFPRLKNESWPLMFCLATAMTGSEDNVHPAGRITGYAYDGTTYTEPSHLVISNNVWGWFIKYLKPWLLRLSKQETIKVWILKSPGVDSYNLRKKILRIDNNNYRVKEVLRRLGSEDPMEVTAIRIIEE